MNNFDHYFNHTGVLSFKVDSPDALEKISALYRVYGVSRVEVEKPVDAVGEARFDRSEVMYHEVDKPIIRVYFDRDVVNVVNAIKALFDDGSDPYKTDLQIVKEG